MTALPTALTFIRHGETDWNRQFRFQGQIDVPLNDTGRAQAALLAARLGPTAPPDLLFSSDLQRARETAAPLAAAWNMAPTLLPALREQHYGVLEGLDVPTIQAEHPALWAEWLQHHADFALPGGGESLRQFSSRVLAAVGQLADANRGRTLVIVTHGGVLDMLWRRVHRLSLNGMRDCLIPNTGINKLLWSNDGELQIVSWADDTHLAVAAPLAAAVGLQPPVAPVAAP